MNRPLTMTSAKGRWESVPTPVAMAAWRTLALTSVAVFVVSLDGTVLFVAFPSIRATFADVSAAQVSWVLNAYTIVFGALLVPAGRIADRIGRKRIFLLGLGLFTCASALCGRLLCGSRQNRQQEPGRENQHSAHV